MSLIMMVRQSHIFYRAPHDWYAEGVDVAAALFAAVEFEGGIVDPACGRGSILVAAGLRDIPAWGGDVVDRSGGEWPGCDEVVDFLTDDRPCDNIVSNPPYKGDIIWRFIDHALAVATDRVAFLLPLRWAASRTTAERLLRSPLESVLIVTPRPSIPPGAVVAKDPSARSGGSVDFAWYVWRRGHIGPAPIGWAFRDASIKPDKVPTC